MPVHCLYLNYSPFFPTFLSSTEEYVTSLDPPATERYIFSCSIFYRSCTGFISNVHCRTSIDSETVNNAEQNIWNIWIVMTDVLQTQRCRYLMKKTRFQSNYILNRHGDIFTKHTVHCSHSSSSTFYVYKIIFNVYQGEERRMYRTEPHSGRPHDLCWSSQTGSA